MGLSVLCVHRGVDDQALIKLNKKCNIFKKERKKDSLFSQQQQLRLDTQLI
jgi:hypothetical protein